ncbi:MAG: thiamine phosphate synthase, partial [Sphingomonadales bacterium]|nr:thiamine phosphate synthase [Sphingomonadales bacterium]
LGHDAVIGVTCHNSRHLAFEAGDKGADYVAFGAFHPTSTKEVSHVAEVDILTWWSDLAEIPCVAIGGITVENCTPLIEAGADFIAVCSAVWDNDAGAEAAVKQFNEKLAPQEIT